LIFIVVIFALMWLLFIRPQRQKQQAQRDLLENVGPGDEIVTAGGLYGTVREAEEEAVMVEVAPGVEVKVAKRAIAAVVPPEEEFEEEEDDSEEADEYEDSEVEAEADERAEVVAEDDSAAEARR
jgi:preprotein translocase subunit YajC